MLVRAGAPRPYVKSPFKERIDMSESKTSTATGAAEPSTARALGQCIFPIAKRGTDIVAACKWMRRSHIDELPQLFNVIRGQMSLVGPRPERPEITCKLERIYPEITQRLAVRPGITGLAQIHNGYDKTIEGTKRKFEADMEYITTRSWTMEMVILATTVTRLYDPAAH